MMRIVLRKVGAGVQWLAGLALLLTFVMGVLYGAIEILAFPGWLLGTWTIVGSLAGIVVNAMLMDYAAERSGQRLSRSESWTWQTFRYHRSTVAVLDAIGWLVASAFIGVMGAVLGAAFGLVLGSAVTTVSPLPWWPDGNAYVAGLTGQSAVAGAVLLCALCAWEAYGEVPFDRWRERHRAA